MDRTPVGPGDQRDPRGKISHRLQHPNHRQRRFETSRVDLAVAFLRNRRTGWPNRSRPWQRCAHRRIRTEQYVPIARRPLHGLVGKTAPSHHSQQWQRLDRCDDPQRSARWKRVHGRHDPREGFPPQPEILAHIHCHHFGIHDEPKLATSRPPRLDAYQWRERTAFRLNAPPQKRAPGSVSAASEIPETGNGVGPGLLRRHHSRLTHLLCIAK